MIRAVLWLQLLCVVGGCVTTAPMQQPPPSFTTTEIELTVKDVEPETLVQLRAEMAKVPELRTAELKSNTGKTAVFIVRYPGDVSDLPRTLASLPHPGLKFGTATHKFEYAAFDNQPPTIVFLHPQPEQVVNTKEPFVTVEIPDKDIASVTIAGKPAPLYKGSVYRLKLELNEGRQELAASAKDKAGNETSARVVVSVDTTAPALNAQIKLLVEGSVEPGSSVLIDGNEVAVDSVGQYRAEIPVRKGQRKVEIVALDRSGNKTVTAKAIGE